MENAEGAQGAGLSVLSRDQAGTIHHRYTIDADFDGEAHDPALYTGDARGIDLYTPVWHLLDLLPHGRENWYPDHGYMQQGSERAGLAMGA